MHFIRNRARLFAAVVLAWHLVAVSAVSSALSCDSDGADHAAMENCPLHRSVPECPLHGENHGTHDCDCPTIGCAQDGNGLMALLGPVGILPTTPELPIPVDAGDASPRAAASASLFPHVPLSPPPRA